MNDICRIGMALLPFDVNSTPRLMVVRTAALIASSGRDNVSFVHA
jgi:hypothetical protein